MFKLFKKKNKLREDLEIDDELIKESRRSKKREFLNYLYYSKKPIEWLEEHLKVIDDVANKHILGDKHKGSFILDGRKFFKSDITRDLFNKMFDNYTSHFFALKRYIILRKELEKMHKLGEEEYLMAGKEKQLELEASNIEKNLNIYLDNIQILKKKIREEAFL